MANKTLLQTRTDYPAVTPIDPDECLILDQQTDQPEGKQSTVATLSELIATGGRTVTTAVAYETLYADSVVNVSASSITITVGSVMRNGSRLLIRRTAAYDGDPVTISPPSGATFEGLASIDLYGQYSYVELERISATVFAIKEIQDTPPLGVEQITNEKWVDGKRVYQKNIDIGALPDTTTKKVAHGITGLDTVVRIYGVLKGPNQFYPLPFVYTDNTYSISLYMDTTISMLYIDTSMDMSSSTGIVTLVYTKT